MNLNTQHCDPFFQSLARSKRLTERSCDPVARRPSSKGEKAKSVTKSECAWSSGTWAWKTVSNWHCLLQQIQTVWSNKVSMHAFLTHLVLSALGVERQDGQVGPVGVPVEGHVGRAGSDEVAMGAVAADRLKKQSSQ